MFNTDLVNKVLLNPISDEADKLLIVSGYSTPTMASWHMKQIKECGLPEIDISLIVGMCPFDGISQNVHEGFKQLVGAENIHGYSNFTCQYVYNGSAVHTKLYIWIRNNVPIYAFTGSVNYTQAGFSTSRREYIVECDAADAYNYYKELESDTIYCNHAEVEESILIKSVHHVLDAEDAVDDDIILEGMESVTLSLLTRGGRGDVGFGSGINWGHRRNGTRREPNQAYISLPASIMRTGFFPLNEQHFSVVTDDQKQLILRVEQENNKAITTPLNNSLIGEYFRNRMGLSNGSFVTKDNMEAYGRTDVTFYKIDEEQFFMDFSV